eukprot:ANDGO_00309.mRNA.1 Enolase superfamily member DDB_G0284701
MNEIAFPVPGTSYRVLLSVESLHLRLRHVFGTSHSSSTSRTNGLFRVLITDERSSSCTIESFGECGLPPKKPGCYFADMKDCHDYFHQVVEQARVFAALPDSYDAFADVPDAYFPSCRRHTCASCEETTLFHTLLYIVDRACGDSKFFRAGKSALECAVLGAWAMLRSVPVWKLAGFEQGEAQCARSFYTAALMQNLDDMVESTRFGLEYTPFIKIKVDDNAEWTAKVLEKLSNLGTEWSIDANAAWNPSISMEMLEVLKPYAEKIFMVEQPFPLHAVLGPDWKAVKDAYNGAGMLIYADESISTFEDVELVAPYVNGVNVKIEKAGGLRGGVRTIAAAHRLGLKVWIGLMVSSVLGTTQAAQLSHLTTDSDLDGGLLSIPDRFVGGFQWGPNGTVILSSDVAYGVRQVGP